MTPMTTETMLSIARQAIANAYKYDDDRDAALSWFDDAVKAAGDVERITAENAGLAAENERLTTKSGKGVSDQGATRRA